MFARKRKVDELSWSIGFMSWTHPGPGVLKTPFSILLFWHYSLSRMQFFFCCLIIIWIMWITIIPFNIKKAFFDSATILSQHIEVIISCSLIQSARGFFSLHVEAFIDLFLFSNRIVCNKLRTNYGNMFFFNLYPSSFSPRCSVIIHTRTVLQQ